MARKTLQTPEPIQGVHYEITQLGFSQARSLFVLLAKKIGPSLAHLADGRPRKDLPLAEMIGDAIRSLDEADLVKITDALATDAKYSVDGMRWPFLSKDAREDLWSGSLSAWFAWIWFALEVNFGDFSVALGSRAASAPEGQTPASSRE